MLCHDIFRNCAHAQNCVGKALLFHSQLRKIRNLYFRVLDLIMRFFQVLLMHFLISKGNQFVMLRRKQSSKSHNHYHQQKSYHQKNEFHHILYYQ